MQRRNLTSEASQSINHSSPNQKLNHLKNPNNTKIINWPCAICLLSNSKISFLQFADCSHKLVCLDCCEKFLINCMRENIKPKCFVESCKEFLYTGENSAFENFSQTVQDNWNVKKDMLMRRPFSRIGVIRNCRVINCKGYLTMKSECIAISQRSLQPNRCLVCRSIHCEKCFNLDHGDSPCPETQINLPQGMKQCPKCEVIIAKQSGCNEVRCTQCSHVFCFNCESAWSQEHMNCKGTIGERILNVFYGIREKLQECCSSNTVVPSVF